MNVCIFSMTCQHLIDLVVLNALHHLVPFVIDPHLTIQVLCNSQPHLLFAHFVCAANDQIFPRTARATFHELTAILEGQQYTLGLCEKRILRRQVCGVQVNGVDVIVPEFRVLFHVGRCTEIAGV